jgi:hypothetical protein
MLQQKAMSALLYGQRGMVVSRGKKSATIKQAICAAHSIMRHSFIHSQQIKHLIHPNILA